MVQVIKHGSTSETAADSLCRRHAILIHCRLIVSIYAHVVFGRLLKYNIYMFVNNYMLVCMVGQ